MRSKWPHVRPPCSIARNQFEQGICRAARGVFDCPNRKRLVRQYEREFSRVGSRTGLIPARDRIKA